MTRAVCRFKVNLARDDTFRGKTEGKVGKVLKCVYPFHFSARYVDTGTIAFAATQPKPTSLLTTDQTPA